MFNYWNKFLKLNHELCQEDPLQQEFKIHHVWIVIFFALIWKTFKSKNVFDMSSKSKPLLKTIRIVGALAGCGYLIIAYHNERCTLARFLLSRPEISHRKFCLIFCSLLRINILLGTYRKESVEQVLQRVVQFFNCWNNFGNAWILVFGCTVRNYIS